VCVTSGSFRNLKLYVDKGLHENYVPVLDGSTSSCKCKAIMIFFMKFLNQRLSHQQTLYLFYANLSVPQAIFIRMKGNSIMNSEICGENLSDPTLICCVPHLPCGATVNAKSFSWGKRSPGHPEPRRAKYCLLEER